MFDIGFWELCLVGLVSLLVIGPERLPKAARIAGYWVGKTRGMVASVKAEIKDELQAEEMRQILKEQADLETFHTLKQESQEVLNEISSTGKALSEDSKKHNP
jgi:sec-independent protein translocase protein TatB